MDGDPSFLFGLWIVLSLLFSAFFSGCEIAFISLNRLKVEVDLNQGKLPAKIISYFLKKPNYFIGAMLVGNNIALVVYGILMGAVISSGFVLLNWHVSPGLELLIETVISTLLVLFVAEYLPKSLFRLNPNKLLSVLAVPLIVVYVVLYIPNAITVLFSEIVLMFISGGKGRKQDNASTVFGKTDLDHFVQEIVDNSRDAKDINHEIQIFQNALNFEDVKVRDCMVPRTDIEAVPETISISDLCERFVETGFSKILVYREDVDHIIGYVHGYELFKNPKTLKSILLPISVIPEAMNAPDVLKLFTSLRKSIAVVVDEFGGTSGVVTLEDIVEEIVGDIEDEYDDESELEEIKGENHYLFSARHEIQYLNQTYGFNFPDEEGYETLAGLLNHEAGDIPKENEEWSIGDWRLIATKVSSTRVEEVEVLAKE